MSETIHEEILSEEPALTQDELLADQTAVDAAVEPQIAEVSPVPEEAAAPAEASDVEPVARESVHNLGGLAARGVLRVKSAHEAVQNFAARDKGEMFRSLFRKAGSVGKAAVKGVRTNMLEHKADFIAQMEGRPYDAVRKEVIAKADSARRRHRRDRQYMIWDAQDAVELAAKQVRALPGHAKEAATLKAQEVKAGIQSTYHEARKSTHDKVSQHVGRVAAGMSGLTERIQSVSNTHAQAAEQHATKAKVARGENVYVQPRLFE